MSLSDCLRVVCERGRLMQECESCRGCMVAVRARSEDVEKAIRDCGVCDEVSLGAVNGDRSVVISGSEVGVSLVLGSESMSGVSHRKLNVSHAFHSPLVSSVLDELRSALISVSLHRPRIRMVSSVTGSLVTDEVTDVSYWLKHAVSTVQSTKALSLALKVSGGQDIFEIAF
jgi:acyl transferase domain-containing protein